MQTSVVERTLLKDKLDDDKIIRINISLLEFDVGMLACVREMGLEHKGKRSKGWRGPLTRLQRVLSSPTGELPPIKVTRKSLYTPLHVRKKEGQRYNYQIIDGRHRVVVALARGETSILAKDISVGGGSAECAKHPDILDAPTPTHGICRGHP